MTKRRIVMFNRVSADGYMAAPDGNLDWAVPDPELDQAATAAMSGPGTILLGRRTYDMFESFWPHALEDPVDPHAPGRRSPEIHAMAVWINDATKLVVSRNKQRVTWKGSKIVPSIDPAAIEAIKAQPGTDIMLFGSASLVHQLTEHGLIDEYILIVNPLLLGDGKPLLRGVDHHTRLRLLEHKATAAGNVRLRYAPAR
jgi:dihydrofolate reductase